MMARQRSSKDRTPRRTVEGFAVSSRRAGELLLLDVVGELDIATAPELREAVATALPGAAADGLPLVLDLTRCTFLDSSGSRAVGMAAREGADAGVRVALVSPRSVTAVRRVVEHVGLAAVMAVHDDLDTALAGEAANR